MISVNKKAFHEPLSLYDVFDRISKSNPEYVIPEGYGTYEKIEKEIYYPHTRWDLRHGLNFVIGLDDEQMRTPIALYPAGAGRRVPG
jgi:hypothetical protein